MSQHTRRQFLKTSSVSVASAFAAPAILSARSPNETVRIAGAGVGGKGWTDINGAASHAEVVAFCDVETGSQSKEKEASEPRRKHGPLPKGMSTSAR